MKKARILPSFLKGIRILQDIASHPEGMKLAEIARELGLPASNVTLYLNTLLSAGVVLRDPLNRRFFISPMTMELFHGSGEGLIHQLIPCADESMKKLHDQFNENVLLGFQKENTVIFIKHISSNHIMSIQIEPEPDFALHTTAAGRAILAFLPEKTIETYIKNATYEKYTSRTIEDETTLRRIISETRANGYAFNPGEFEETVMAIAAPIMIGNRPVASLVIQFPTLRHSPEDAQAAGKDLIEQARIIEKKLQPK
ncbi:IclR family transcriptional regulator [Tichowtungia aerotolerans]|uniref:Helix-turn-helix domain-containing protein n=1 Tax=Tichowtungia aerotolerans TaxID=2697043 RepID=A0A6P1M3D5_9BACT|nr:IclR family transcriptional regulator [Tichowtungia aerotolerans]QHI68331.1 helix-turn-helix domain-containing protein [Tichowtungia aerotolerans]